MKECVDADMADLPPAGVGQEDLLLPGLLPTATAPQSSRSMLKSQEAPGISETGQRGQRDFTRLGP